MKKIIVVIFISMFLLSSCQTEMVALGVREYDPDADEPESIHVDFMNFYSLAELVDLSDLIGVARVDTLKYVKVDLEDDSISESRGMYAELYFTNILLSGKKGVSEGLTVNVYIEYDPDYENIADPEITEGEEYLFFLAGFENDAPAVFTDFFDYHVIGDHAKFRMEASEENINSISALIKKQK